MRCEHSLPASIASSRARNSGRVAVERLFTHRWRLEQAEEAYRLFDTQTTGKAVILPS